MWLVVEGLEAFSEMADASVPCAVEDSEGDHAQRRRGFRPGRRNQTAGGEGRRVVWSWLPPTNAEYMTMKANSTFQQLEALGVDGRTVVGVNNRMTLQPAYQASLRSPPQCRYFADIEHASCPPIGCSI